MSKTIDRYIISQFLRKFLIFFASITLIVFFNSFILVLKESIQYPHNFIEIAQIISLKTASKISILITVSLFFSLLLTIAGFHKNNEFYIFQSAGIGGFKFLKILTPLLAIFIFVSFLNSLFFSPIYELQIDKIRSSVKGNVERVNIQDSQFTIIDNGRLFIFAEDLELLDNREVFGNIFFFEKDEFKNSILFSENGQKIIGNDNIFLSLNQGERIFFNKEESNYQVTNFDNLTINLSQYTKTEVTDKVYDYNLMSLNDLLLNLTSTQVKAEIYWRLIQPLSVFSVILLGFIPLTGSPRSNNLLVNSLSIASFFLFFTLLISIKSMIETDIFSLLLALTIANFIPLIVILKLIKKYAFNTLQTIRHI